MVSRGGALSKGETKPDNDTSALPKRGGGPREGEAAQQRRPMGSDQLPVFRTGNITDNNSGAMPPLLWLAWPL